MITRQEILEKAVHECLREMYLWAQPSIDIDKLIESGYKDSKFDPLYKKYYLSTENFQYIIDTYVDAYNIKSGWDNHFDLLIHYLNDGGLKDKYIPQDGEKPGYRSYEEVPSIYKYLDKEDADIALSLIEECHNFYKTDHENNKFTMTMALGVGSPMSNKESVEKYWHENGRPDFKIKEFNIDDILYNKEDMTEEEFKETLK